jgi:hypothetical protein
MRIIYVQNKKTKPLYSFKYYLYGAQFVSMYCYLAFLNRKGGEKF